MSLSNNNKEEISTYPGEYVPDYFKLENLVEELSKYHEGGRKPDYNMSETSEYYKIELATPGLQREDFFVNINESGFLSISALHNKQAVDEDEHYKKHTFNYECFHREILLPIDADTDFLKTEYRKGILTFWFLKAAGTYTKRASNIVVY
jgi:HSP20 family protein